MQDVFDYKGILSASNCEEIIELVDRVDDNLYSSLSDSIERNFHAAEKFASIDDCIHEAIVRNLPRFGMREQ